LKAFLDVSEAEKKVLIEKIAQRNNTIHQLTHHLHSLQALTHMPQTQYRLSEEAMLAAEVTFEKDRMDPAPWEPTSSGDRTDRMNMTASTNTSMNSSSPLLSPYHHHQVSLSGVAFAHHVTASLPPYRGEPLVLPAWDLLEQSAIEGNRVRRDGVPVTTSPSTPSPSRSLHRSSAVDRGDRGAKSIHGCRDADTSPAPAYTANSHRPYINSNPPSSSSSSPLPSPWTATRSSNLRVEESERRSNTDLLQSSYSHRGGAGGRVQQLYQQQQQQHGEQEQEEEERWIRAGDRDRDVGRKSYSKSPTTPSSLGHGRTVVLSWQGQEQGKGQGQGSSCPPLHAVRHCRDVEGYREVRQAPYIGCRDRDRDRAKEEDEHSGSRYRGNPDGRWIESDAASEDMSTHSAHPLMDSVLTADTVTLADTDNAREKDRERGGNGAQKYKHRYSN
jgi:hypothetical protein